VDNPAFFDSRYRLFVTLSRILAQVCFIVIKRFTARRCLVVLLSFHFFLGHNIGGSFFQL
jgi:hypothetical protein